MPSLVRILSNRRQGICVGGNGADHPSIEDIQREALLAPCEPFPWDELPGFLLGLIATTGFVFVLPFIITAILAGVN